MNKLRSIKTTELFLLKNEFAIVNFIMFFCKKFQYLKLKFHRTFAIHYNPLQTNLIHSPGQSICFFIIGKRSHAHIINLSLNRRYG